MKGLCIPVQCIRVSESSLFTVLTFSFYGKFFLISSYLISCVSFSFSPPHCCPLHFHFHLHSNISKMLTILQIHVCQPPVVIVCTASSNQTTLLMTFKMALLIIYWWVDLTLLLPEVISMYTVSSPYNIHTVTCKLVIRILKLIR